MSQTAPSTLRHRIHRDGSIVLMRRSSGARGPRACRSRGSCRRRRTPSPRRRSTSTSRSGRSCRTSASTATAPTRRTARPGCGSTRRRGRSARRKSGGHAIVPGNLEESELFARITAEDETERMPPKSLGRTLSPDGDRPPQALDRARRRVEGALGVPAAGRGAGPRGQGRRPGPGTRSTGSSWPGSRPSGSAPAPEAEQGAADPPRHVRPDRAAPRRSPRSTPSWPTDARTPTSGWSTACWPRRGSASGWPSTGSTWPATPTPTATRPTSIAPCGPGATGSSRPSTPICPTTSSSPGNWPATCCPRPTRDQVLATAFNRHHRQTNEGGSIEEEFRVEYVADRTNTFATAFLGLTLECARCHNHKYDPITQKEYYHSSASSTASTNRGSTRTSPTRVPTPTLLLTIRRAGSAIAAAEAKIKAAEAELDRLAEAAPAGVRGLAPSRRIAAASPLMTGLIGDFPLDAIEGRQGRQPGRSQEARPDVGGPRAGRGAGRQGASSSAARTTSRSPWATSTASSRSRSALWIKTPDIKDRAVIIHRSMAWTDAGSRGYQLLIEDGKLSVGLIHFWPGNAIGIQAREPVPINQWVHVDDRPTTARAGPAAWRSTSTAAAPIARSSATSSPRTSPAGATTI